MSRAAQGRLCERRVLRAEIDETTAIRYAAKTRQLLEQVPPSARSRSHVTHANRLAWASPKALMGQTKHLTASLEGRLC
jgi:hypothetical protein